MKTTTTSSGASLGSLKSLGSSTNTASRQTVLNWFLQQKLTAHEGLDFAGVVITFEHKNNGNEGSHKREVLTVKLREKPWAIVTTVAKLQTAIKNGFTLRD